MRTLEGKTKPKSSREYELAKQTLRQLESYLTVVRNGHKGGDPSLRHVVSRRRDTITICGRQVSQLGPIVVPLALDDNLCPYCRKVVAALVVEVMNHKSAQLYMAKQLRVSEEELDLAIDRYKQQWKDKHSV